MRRIRIILLGLLAAALVLGGTATSGAGRPKPAATPDTYVTGWDAVFTQAFTAAALTPAEGAVLFADTSIAVYDSVVAIKGGFRPFAIKLRGPKNASAEAAVAAAARTTLANYLPAQVPTIIDPAYALSLASIPDGKAKTQGIAVGKAVAELFIAERSDDGFRTPVTYTPPNPPIPGVWLPTAPTPPVGTYLGLMRPFALQSPMQFRPAGPPALGSARWAQAYNEVKTIGSSTAPASVRTADQTLAARFWGEPPVQQAHGAYRKFVLDHQLGIVDAARLMAMLGVNYADTLIACFDAKYHFKFWRPITAVRAGDTDGNAGTVGDAGWSPLLPATPNHPEYPSAHSCITPASGRVLARFLGTDKIDLTIPSLTGLGDRHYDRVSDLEYEVGNARIWGGIHYRFSIDDAIVIGTKTVNQMLAHHFRPAKGWAVK